MRILVAEDERNLNRILTEALTDEGYSVDPCFDGQEAWDALACAEYDVLVLDIMMPRMDGLTLVRKLRESGSTTPVLFLTSRDSVEDKVEGLETRRGLLSCKAIPHAGAARGGARDGAQVYRHAHERLYDRRSLRGRERAHGRPRRARH